MSADGCSFCHWLVLVWRNRSELHGKRAAEIEQVWDPSGLQEQVGGVFTLQWLSLSG